MFSQWLALGMLLGIFACVCGVYVDNRKHGQELGEMVKLLTRIADQK